MDITDQELSHQETTLSENQGRVLLLACGALAREILDIINRHGFTHLDLKCLPAILHNAPEKITPLIEEKIAEHRAAYDDIYVLYADCGTGGLLQAACDRLGVKMLRGPHCYSFFEGNDDFAKRDEFTAFYLTDFLVRQFDAFVWKPFGIGPPSRSDIDVFWKLHQTGLSGAKPNGCIDRTGPRLCRQNGFGI